MTPSPSTATDTLHASVTRLVGPAQRVLHLGTGCGDLTRHLAAHGCQIVGVEADPEAAARAAEFCERVIVGDPETLDYRQELADDRFDVIVVVNVLEHLKYPLAVLTSVRPFLKSAGSLVAALPNIAHGSIRLALLGGHFPYSEAGLLQQAHLRFFTHASLERLLEDAGFVVGQLERETRPLDAHDIPAAAGLVSNGLLDALQQDPEAQTLRFIVVAYPLPRTDLQQVQQRIRDLLQAREAAEARVHALQADNAAVQARLQAVSADYAAAQAQIAALHTRQVHLEAEVQALRQALADQTADLAILSQQVTLAPHREVEMRAMLLEAHDKLLQRDEETFKLRRDLANAFETIRWMESSRSWQFVQQTWSLRSRLRSLFKR